MKFSRRTWAIILLVFIVIGGITAFVSFSAGKNALGGTAAFIIVAAGLGSYLLKKEMYAEQDEEAEAALDNKNTGREKKRAQQDAPENAEDAEEEGRV